MQWLYKSITGARYLCKVLGNIEMNDIFRLSAPSKLYLFIYLFGAKLRTLYIYIYNSV